MKGLETDPGLRGALGGTVRVALEKPLAAIDVAGGPCLPDFLLTVARPGAYDHLPGGPGTGAPSRPVSTRATGRATSSR